MAYKYLSDYLFATIKVSCDKCIDYIYNDTFNAIVERNSEQVGTTEQLSHFFGEPVHIINNIYLGSAINAARFYELHDDYNIGVIINVTKEISNYYPEQFIYKNYDVSDVNTDSIIHFLEEAYDFIKEHSDKNILVHCFMGASRSASLVAYYLMREYNMSLEEAIIFLKGKRSIININSTFVSELSRSINN